MSRDGDTMTGRLVISELFGPTIQGEGPTQGRAVMFLRLGLCNLDCRWCDTPYTWDWTGKNGIRYDRDAELTTMPVDDVFEQLQRQAGPVRRIVITGGEPMIQQRSLTRLIADLRAHGFNIEIETNGTLMPDDQMSYSVQFNVSPKLANSGINVERRINYDVLTRLSMLDSTFKFVVATPWDINEIDEIVDRLYLDPHRVYVMPEGTNVGAITRQLPGVMAAAADRGWSVSPRLHVIAHDNKRGV